LAVDGGQWSASLPGHFTARRKSPWYPFGRRLGGWVQEPVWTYWRREKSLVPAGIPNQPVAQKLYRNAISYPK